MGAIKKIYSTKFGVWHETYIFMSPEQQSALNDFTVLIDTRDDAAEKARVAVKPTLDALGITSRKEFGDILLPDKKSGLWPYKTDGKPLTPQAVNKRIAEGNYKGLSDWAIAATPYLLALERGLNRKRAEGIADGTVERQRSSRKTKTKTKTKTSDKTETKVSERFTIVKSEHAFILSLISGLKSSIGKASAADILTALISELEEREGKLQLELFKLKGESTNDKASTKLKILS